MPDHDDPRAAPKARRPAERFEPAATAIIVCCGVMGAAGVAISAAATHAGGGALASTAGSFLLLHAAVALALAALAKAIPTVGSGLILSAWIIMLGTVVFSTDLALSGFASLRPFPVAAPIGGMMMIAGWIGVPATVLLAKLGGD